MDIEKSLIDFLNNSTLSVTAYAEVPADRPTSFITIERTGGTTNQHHVDHPICAIQCWADTRYNASILAQQVRELLLRSFIEQSGVRRVAINSMYSFPDLTAHLPRYQIVAEITTVL